jgi:hypothetical protein
MSDPRDHDLRNPNLDRSAGVGANVVWGWIAGAVFVVIALILVFGYGMNSDTASNTATPPAATTGAGTTAPKPAPSPVPPPAANTTPSPSSPSSPANPGSGGQAR